jgi:hypothetical protein
MTRSPSRRDQRQPTLTGWKLVVALLVLAAVIVATLLINGSPEAALIVTVPLLLVLGVITSPHL